MTNELPENVFPICYPPTKEQANAKGDVLWYCKAFGWYKGWFQRPHQSNTTHWTYLPDEPELEENPLDVRERSYQRWLSTFPAEFDPAALSLLKLGFVGGYESRGNP